MLDISTYIPNEPYLLYMYNVRTWMYIYHVICIYVQYLPILLGNRLDIYLRSAEHVYQTVITV